ncbi:MAG TPA: OmpA family protein, partial [Candidatus Prevotella intestinigallinarum]|nr:OmpA family protein [Candidatus Prevotella intestinigallinarum]
YFNFHFDALFNLSNLLCGYNEKRVYNLSAYGGLGVMKVSEEPSATDISAHFGLLNSFRLSSALDLNLDLRGTMVNDEFDGEPGGRGGEGMFTATIGLTYKFKPRGWDRSKTVTRLVYNNDEINAMREKLNLMSEENARLKEALARGGQEREKIVAAANLVIFEIGKSKLSNLSRANLGLLAEVIKQGDPNAVYTVTGYADKGTGSKGLNERLSKKRAEAVFDCLVNEYGVNKSQLKIDYKGGVDNMFYDDPRLSRAVITRSN